MIYDDIWRGTSTQIVISLFSERPRHTHFLARERIVFASLYLPHFALVSQHWIAPVALLFHSPPLLSGQSSATRQAIYIMRIIIRVDNTYKYAPQYVVHSTAINVYIYIYIARILVRRANNDNDADRCCPLPPAVPPPPVFTRCRGGSLCRIHNFIKNTKIS